MIFFEQFHAKIKQLAQFRLADSENRVHLDLQCPLSTFGANFDLVGPISGGSNFGESGRSPVNIAYAGPNRAVVHGHTQVACIGWTCTNPRHWLAYET